MHRVTRKSKRKEQSDKPIGLMDPYENYLQIMKKYFVLTLVFFISFSCKQNTKQQNKEDALVTYQKVVSEQYTLYKPKQDTRAVLFLFGGYPETAKDIQREFPIVPLARSKKIAVVFSNFNQKLWLEKKEKHSLAEQLQKIVERYDLPKDNIFIGGFSSGGVVSLFMSEYIVSMKQFYIDPKGVFIVDSPIDLSALHASAKKNVARNFSNSAVQEGKWILENLENAFGTPEDSLHNYEKASVFTYKTRHISNVQRLKNTKIRLYTEPDTLWWKTNRMVDYKQTNAFYIKEFSESLKANGFENVEYISTSNKGYRANGERHPHSWSIVDKSDLINWILDEKNDSL